MSAFVRRPGLLIAALIALLMLSYASVRSTVMQVAMGAEAPFALICDGGMAMRAGDMSAQVGALRAGLAKGAQAPAKSCPYCAAAAHLPLINPPAPVLSSCAVRFVAYRLQSLHGARGPPARRPRVRDPPALFLSV